MLYNYVNTSKFWASLDDVERAYGLENHSAGLSNDNSESDASTPFQAGGTLSNNVAGI